MALFHFFVCCTLQQTKPLPIRFVHYFDSVYILYDAFNISSFYFFAFLFCFYCKTTTSCLTTFPFDFFFKCRSNRMHATAWIVVFLVNKHFTFLFFLDLYVFASNWLGLLDAIKYERLHLHIYCFFHKNTRICSRKREKCQNLCASAYVTQIVCNQREKKLMLKKKKKKQDCNGFIKQRKWKEKTTQRDK